MKGLVDGHGRRHALCAIALATCLTACGDAGESERAGGGPEGDAAAPERTSVRALAVAPSFAEIAVAIGAADQLVARTDFDTEPALQGLPSVGGGLDPNLEAMVDIGVGLVLMPEGRDTPAIAAQFEALGIEVLALPTQSIADLHTTIRLVGEVFGREEAAELLSERISADLDEIAERVRDRDPVSVMYVVWSDPPMTTGGGIFIDEIVTIAGGRNVYADAVMEWPTVGYESIVERDPDVVLWPEGDITAETTGRIAQMAGWAQVPAIQDGRVVLIDGDLFGRPGPNVVEAARVLANALHPGAF